MTRKSGPKRPARETKKAKAERPAAELLSARGYARHRGVSHVSVLKALRSGRISSRSDGLIDPVLADREWAANTNPTKPANSVTGDPKRHGRHRPPGAIPEAFGGALEADEEGEVVAPSSVAASYATSRAMRERILARLAKVELDEKLGRLVEADQVRISTFNLARSARNQLLALPDRVAPILASMTSARDVHALLATEVRRICEELAGGANAAEKSAGN